MSRFLIFGANYWPEPIGCAQYTTPYAEALVDAGHEVTVVAAYPHYPSWTSTEVRLRPTRQDLKGVSVLRVPAAVPRRASTSGRAVLEASYGAAALAASAAIRHVDALIGVVPFLSAGLAAAASGRLRRKPYGVLVQDLVSAAARQGGVPGADRAAAFVSRAEHLFIGATQVGVVARGFEQPVRERGGCNVWYLPNFSLLGAPRSMREETRCRLAIDQDAFVAMYSGNLGFKQDFASVLDAAERVACRDASVLFVIVGEGSQREWIEAEVARRNLANVVLRPLQAEEDLPDVLACADVLVAPQRPTDVDMSVPSKLTAYLSAGRPVIAGASEASETARIVRESGAGLVVPPSNGEALACAVLELRGNPTRLCELGEAGRVFASTTFARGPALDRFVAFAESVLG